MVRHRSRRRCHRRQSRPLAASAFGPSLDPGAIHEIHFPKLCRCSTILGTSNSDEAMPDAATIRPRREATHAAATPPPSRTAISRQLLRYQSATPTAAFRIARRLAPPPRQPVLLHLTTHHSSNHYALKRPYPPLFHPYSRDIQDIHSPQNTCIFPLTLRPISYIMLTTK